MREREGEKMKAILRKVMLLVGVCLLTFAGSCILEDKVIEIVFTDQTCVPFEENHDSEDYTTPMVLDYGDELSQILEDNDLDRSDILKAKMVSASYLVTDFSHSHDWVISGYVRVERLDITDGPETIVNYTSQSLQQAMTEHIPATLDAEGVGLVNRALDDFTSGMNPVLRFTVHSADVVPDPSPGDPIVFDWEACIVIQVVTEEDFEQPDIF
jgi:hypothetical protein